MRVQSTDAVIRHPLFYQACRAALLAFTKLCRCTCSGLENVPRSGPFIVAANHQSYIDPPVLGRITKRPLSYLAMEELFTLPVLDWLIPRLNAHPIRRGGPDVRALKTGLSILEAGEGLVIFPEGMRSPDGKLLQPKLGVAQLALRSRAPVIPVGLNGTNRVLPVWSTSDGEIRVYPRNRPILIPKRFHIGVGQPLTFPALYDKPRWSRHDLRHVAESIMVGIAQQLGQTFRWSPDEEWWRPWASVPSGAERLADREPVE